MQEIISRVKNIQNKAKSLKWGSCMYDDYCIVFVVGHNTYNKDLYFKVKVSRTGISSITILRQNGEEVDFGHKCSDVEMLLIEIGRLLAKEFPATGGAR